MRKLMLALVVIGASLATLATPSQANAWWGGYRSGYYAYPAYYNPPVYSNYYSYPAYSAPTYTSYYYTPAVGTLYNTGVTNSYTYYPTYTSYYAPAYTSSYYTPSYSSYYSYPGYTNYSYYPSMYVRP